jgi:hypothetical protein
MMNFRFTGGIAVVALMSAALGGCPLADDSPQDTALPAESGLPTDDTDAKDTADQPGLLNDLASQIASGGGGDEYAWSEGSTTISINPDTDGGNAGGGGFGTNPGNNAGGGSDGGGDSDDSDDPGDAGDEGDSDDPGNDPPNAPPGGSDSGIFRGTVQCAYRESLWDDEQFYGEITEDVTYEETIGFDDQGVPASIPVHPFISNDHTVRFQTTARFTGQTDTFTFGLGSVEYDVTLLVVAATYSPQAAHVEFEIDFVWIGGDGTSIVAAGTHTLDTQAAGSNLMYSAYTEYEGVFTAADDWVGYGTTEYDCSGTLTEQ